MDEDVVISSIDEVETPVQGTEIAPAAPLVITHHVSFVLTVHNTAAFVSNRGVHTGLVQACAGLLTGIDASALSLVISESGGSLTLAYSFVGSFAGK